MAVTVVPAACTTNNNSSKAIISIANVQVFSLQLSSAARHAAGGNVDAFASIKQLRDEIAKSVTHLKQAAPGNANTAGLDKALAQLSSDTAAVLEHQQQILAAKATAEDFNVKMPVLNSRMDEVVKLLALKSGSPSQVMIASHEMLLAERMQRRIATVLGGAEDAPSAANGLQRDAQYYGVVLASLVKGNADLGIKAMDNPGARSILEGINQQWTDLSPQLTKLFDGASDLQALNEAADRAVVDSQTVVLQAEALMQKLNQ